MFSRWLAINGAQQDTIGLVRLTPPDCPGESV
jgi:hypothetical protein